MTWYVYIAQARTGRYYTGISQNTDQRLYDHKRGKGAKFAHDQGLSHFAYVSHSFETKSEARKREIQIKGWKREKKEKLIRGEWE